MPEGQDRKDEPDASGTRRKSGLDSLPAGACAIARTWRHFRRLEGRECSVLRRQVASSVGRLRDFGARRRRSAAEHEPDERDIVGTVARSDRHRAGSGRERPTRNRLYRDCDPQQGRERADGPPSFRRDGRYGVPQEVRQVVSTQGRFWPERMHATHVRMQAVFRHSPDGAGQVFRYSPDGAGQVSGWGDRSGRQRSGQAKQECLVLRRRVWQSHSDVILAPTRKESRIRLQRAVAFDGCRGYG